MRRRSAPATGTRARLSSRMMAWKSSARRCTRIITSPGRMARPSVAGEGAGGGEPAGDLVGDAAGEHEDRVVGGAGVDGVVPGGLVGLLGLVEERPELDAAGLVGVDGVVGDAAGEALAGGPGEDGVDEARGSAARSGRSAGGRSAAARRRCRRGRGGSGRAWRRTRPGRRPGSCRSTASRRRRRRWCGVTSRAPAPAKNSSDSAWITCHWRGAGVLGLVDEDVVEAAVEPPEHPGGGAGPGEQRAGAVDEVVEVEEAGGGLAGVEGVEPGAGEAVERRRSGGRRRWRGGGGGSASTRVIRASSAGHEGRVARRGTPWSGNLPTLAAKAFAPDL